MELTGEVIIDAPRERVWSALNDASALQACIPGCEEVIDESPTVRRARVMVKMGPVRARFNGRVTLSEVEPPSRCVMSFEGSGGAAGMASGRSQVELHEATPDGTRLTYTVKASVGGKLGQVGGRMIDASAKQLADQFSRRCARCSRPRPRRPRRSRRTSHFPSPAIRPSRPSVSPLLRRRKRRRIPAPCSQLPCVRPHTAGLFLPLARARVSCGSCWAWAPRPSACGSERCFADSLFSDAKAP